MKKENTLESLIGATIVAHFGRRIAKLLGCCVTGGSEAGSGFGHQRWIDGVEGGQRLLELKMGIEESDE